MAPGGVCANVTGFICPTSWRSRVSTISSTYMNGTSDLYRKATTNRITAYISCALPHSANAKDNAARPVDRQIHSRDAARSSVRRQQMNTASHKADNGDQREHVHRQSHAADGVIGLRRQ